MSDDFLTKREFDGFGSTVREEFKRLGESLTQVSVKIDTLVNGRVEEARVIGEISGEIRSINQRLERLEKDNDSKQNQINELWEENNKHSDGKLRWYGQLVLYVVVAIVSTLFGTKLSH